MVHHSLKNWKDSATLIMAARIPFSCPMKLNKSKFDYEVLTMQRSSRSSFMANTFVFPGGITEKSDSARGWLQLFEKHGFTNDIIQNFGLTKTKAAIYEDGDNEISKFVSLRITAIREAFEESGILICRDSKTSQSDFKYASFYDGPNLERWQNEIHDNPTKFLDMCYELNIYPDIWALAEWSNWLTPSLEKKRFNTIFYLALLNKTPPHFAEKSEVEDLLWNTPDGYIRETCEEHRILLPPPQFYEISRMLNFQRIEDLCNFAHGRSVQGSECYLPVRIDTSAGSTYLLPGDDLYSKYLEFHLREEYPEMESVPECRNMHRLRLKFPFQYRVVLTNFVSNVSHVNPINLHPPKSSL